MMANVVRTERGWAGHFIRACRCGFRRNTLLDAGTVKVVVSTVGNYTTTGFRNGWGEISPGRAAETMAFVAHLEKTKSGARYWDADVGREVFFTSRWSLSMDECTDDHVINEMHEAVVDEIAHALKKGRLQEVG